VVTGLGRDAEAPTYTCGVCGFVRCETGEQSWCGQKWSLLSVSRCRYFRKPAGESLEAAINRVIMLG
jgi:hypothetical protein